MNHRAVAMVMSIAVALSISQTELQPSIICDASPCPSLDSLTAATLTQYRMRTSLGCEISNVRKSQFYRSMVCLCRVSLGGSATGLSAGGRWDGLGTVCCLQVGYRYSLELRSCSRFCLTSGVHLRWKAHVLI